MMTHASFLVLHLGVVAAIFMHDSEDLDGSELLFGLVVGAANLVLACWRVVAMVEVLSKS